MELRSWLDPRTQLNGWRSRTITEPHEQKHRPGQIIEISDVSLTIAALFFQHSLSRTAQGRHTTCWSMFLDFLFAPERGDDGFTRHFCETSGAFDAKSVSTPLELASLWAKKVKEKSGRTAGCRACVAEMTFHLDQLPEDELEWLRDLMLKYEDMITRCQIRSEAEFNKVLTTIETWQQRLKLTGFVHQDT